MRSHWLSQILAHFGGRWRREWCNYKENMLKWELITQLTPTHHVDYRGPGSVSPPLMHSLLPLCSGPMHPLAVSCTCQACCYLRTWQLLLPLRECFSGYSLWLLPCDPAQLVPPRKGLSWWPHLYYFPHSSSPTHESLFCYFPSTLHTLYLLSSPF